MPGRDWQEHEDFEPMLQLGGPMHYANSDEELQALIGETMTILQRCGGVIAISAVREKVGPNEYVPRGFAFKWDSFAPTVQSEPQAPAEQNGQPEHSTA